MRAQVEKKIANKEKVILGFLSQNYVTIAIQEGKEKELRALAKMARDKRAGIRSPESGSRAKDDDEGMVIYFQYGRNSMLYDRYLTIEKVAERNQIRKERHDQRARERNIARAAPGKQ